MVIADEIVSDWREYLDGKRVLEVACGNSDFSVAATKYAEEVLATDISLERAEKNCKCLLPDNLRFKEMNAAALGLEDNSFDVVVCFNALGHLKGVLEPVLSEMARVTAQNGCFMFIATWKMDIEHFGEVKKIINEDDKLELAENIENTKYSVFVVKKTA